MHWCFIVLTFFLIVNGNSSNAGKLNWWHNSVMYQMLPRSFKDSNNDGTGDLKGIEEKAEYLKELGIDIVLLTPIFKSPMFDMGYDISNFKMVDPLFGTMEDFISLQKKLESLGIRLGMDFVLNHSSDEHDWFQKSIEKIDPYTDYYVWRDPKGWINETTPMLPNNWISVFEKPTWTYHPTRKQFYLHKFTAKQPDLNFRCKEVVKEMKSVLRFWLDRGVFGFRFDAATQLVEHAEFLDDPIIGDLRVNGQIAYQALEHKYSELQPENFELLSEFRKVLDSYTKRDGQTRLVMPEIYERPEAVMRFYGNDTTPISHFPFNFYLVEDSYLNNTSNANDLENTIRLWMDYIPKGKEPNWGIGNHDRTRVATRFDSSSVDNWNILLLLLPGIALTYYGEEIGMEDNKLRWDQTVDPWGLNLGPKLYNTKGRDPMRTPFQWDSSAHAGFSKTTGKTWLPVNPNYYELNVENQKNDPKSHYSIYRDLMKLRSYDAFRYGDFQWYVVSNWIFAFKRSLPNEAYLIIINLNNELEQADLNSIGTPQNFKVILTSGNSEYNAGDRLNKTNMMLQMRPKTALVLQEMPK